MDNIATHECPAWGSRANYIIRADLTSYGMPGRFEQIWARQLDGMMLFEVCCIPFFTYGIALGDTVATDDSMTISYVSSKGGHRSFRVALAVPTLDKSVAKLHETLHGWINDLQLPYEWGSAGYLAVDIANESQLEQVQNTINLLDCVSMLSWEIDQ